MATDIVYLSSRKNLKDTRSIKYISSFLIFGCLPLLELAIAPGRWHELITYPTALTLQVQLFDTDGNLIDEIYRYS